MLHSANLTVSRTRGEPRLHRVTQRPAELKHESPDEERHGFKRGIVQFHRFRDREQVWLIDPVLQDENYIPYVHRRHAFHGGADGGAFGDKEDAAWIQNHPKRAKQIDEIAGQIRTGVNEDGNLRGWVQSFKREVDVCDQIAKRRSQIALGEGRARLPFLLDVRIAQGRLKTASLAVQLWNYVGVVCAIRIVLSRENGGFFALILLSRQVRGEIEVVDESA
jgi:hypothetical protein